MGKLSVVRAQSQMISQSRLSFGHESKLKTSVTLTDYSLAIKKLTVHANLPELNKWLRDRFVTG